MINPAIFIGEPLWYGKIKIYPPSVKEVCSNPFYPQYKQFLTISQEEIEDIFVEQKKNVDEAPTPFKYICDIATESPQGRQLLKSAFKLFIGEEVEFLPDINAIIIGNIEEILVKAKKMNDLILIKEENYFEFQNLIRQACGEKPIEPPNPNQDPRIKRIKAKARYRDKIKAKKGMGISLSTCLTSICCMGIGITPLNIGEMSYAAVSALMERYQEYEKYHLDIDSLLAGADSKKIKPKYWIRNLD